MTKPDLDYFRREFLNLSSYGGTAFIQAKLSTDDFEQEIIIADCNKIITLELGSWDKEARINTLHKLNLLIDTITEFKAAYLEFVPTAQALEKKRTADRKKGVLH